jgi:hypothetical protein
MDKRVEHAIRFLGWTDKSAMHNAAQKANRLKLNSDTPS